MPILWLCLFTTKSHFYYLTYWTKNHGRSIDAHFQDGAGSVLLSLWPIKDAYTSITCIHYRVVFYYRTYWTNNCWRSVDTHFQDGAGSVMRSLLTIKHANTSIRYIHYQIAFWLPDLQHQKSLALRWRSFCHGHIHNISSLHLAEYIINNILTAFLSSSGTIFFITSLFFNNTYK